MPITVIKMASPGNSAIHHSSAIYSRPSATMRPQVGMLDGTPSPKKLSDASKMIIFATSSVAITMIEAVTLGRI